MRKILSALFLFGAVFIVHSADASAAIRTWDGGGASNNITDAANWDGDTAVADGDSLVLDSEVHPLGGSITLNNDTSFTFAGMTLRTADTGIRGVTLTGNAYNVSGGMTFDFGMSSNEIPSSIVFNSDVNLSASFSMTAANTVPGLIIFNNPVTSASSVTYVGFNTTLVLRASNPGLGALTVQNGTLKLDLTTANQAAILGSPSTATALAGGDIQICAAGGPANSSRTLSENITVLASASTITFDAIDASYCESMDFYDTLTLDGTITLINDLEILGTPRLARVLITGTLNNSSTITLGGSGTILEINAATNNSGSPNGLFRQVAVDTNISDGEVLTSPFYVANTEVVTYGKTAGTDNIAVLSGATLMGSGVTTGTLSVASGATLSPGNSPGCLSVGNTTLAGTFDVELGGTTACTGYDQLVVTGSVDISGATLDTSRFNNFEPAVGNSFTIIDNDTALDAVTGTFTGLLEDAAFTLNGYTFQVSYIGGDGNDVTLTVTAVAPNAPTADPQSTAATPGTPNTGMRLLMANPLLTLVGTIISAGSLIVLGRKYSLIS